MGPAKLPTHRINPNIDAERAYIAGSLGLKEFRYLQVVNPQAGTNASGDIFFTDGKGTVTFITCKKDFCYNFSKKAKLLSEMVASADFFADYDKKYLSSNN